VGWFVRLPDRDELPGVAVVMGEPDLPDVELGRRGVGRVGRDNEALAACGHGSGECLTGLVGRVQARGGAGCAMPGAAVVPGDIDVAAGAGEDDRAGRGDRDLPEVAAARRAGQAAPGAAVVRGQVGLLAL